ncbi:hypothetical protein Q7P35_012046 [Cladosporium inversicolor]
MDASLSGATGGASFTSNRDHVAFAKSGTIYVGKLDAGNYEKRCGSSRPHPFGLPPILALSPLRTHLLAISVGSRTSIWDVRDEELKYTVHASERSVTSLAWSNHDADILALGHIDGHISVWDLAHLTKPKHVWLAGNAQCHFLAWSLAEPSRLAACCGQTMSIWNDENPCDQSTRRCDLEHQADRILWRPHLGNDLITLTLDGTYEEWSTNNIKSASRGSDECQDHDLFGDLEDLESYDIAPLSRGDFVPAYQVHAIGSTAILMLARHGRHIRLYSDLQSAENDEPIWDKQLMSRIEHMAIVIEEDDVLIIATGFQGMERMPIPSTAREQLGDMGSCFTAGKNVDQPETGQATKAAKSPSKMRPIQLSATPRVHKSERGSQPNHTNMRLMPPARPVTAPSGQKNMKTHSAVSPRQAMASSLELPKLDDEESPMPFLSPTIPSQRPSPSTIPALADDITLPPLESESFGSLPSTAMNDSDSDDETFDGDALKGSGTLMMPGAANVPLPKSCGAFFSPNGQLITYFPPKARVRSMEIDGFSSSQPEERSTKASRLFPLFGNLSIEARDYEDSDSESMSTQSDTASDHSTKIEPFSFSSHGEQSWEERLENMQPLPRLTAGEQPVVVSIRDVNEIIHFRPELAHSYKLSCDSEEAAGRVSLENAEIAQAAGLDDLANVWCLLGLLLQDRLPEDLLTAADMDVTTAARGASRLVRSNSGLRPSTRRQSSAMGVSHMSQSKAGASWLVSQIFTWTELRADVQMLACLSAVLLSSAQSKPRPTKTHVVLSGSRSSLPVSDYFADGASHNSHPSTLRTPILQHVVDSSREGSFLTHSPAKPPRSSHVSSRDPSQPTTPYVDSLSSTPPFPFPKLSRQGSRLSASGSASPEHHRSSFGAAAKFYAQSITDKISSYGTSPPARRFGTSPNNELSSSLPVVGSWSKSVSFASGVDFGNRSSANIAPDDDGYDSDRTIEDTSLPHTPKRYGGPVMFTLKNTSAFLPSKELPLQNQQQQQQHPLLSPLLAAKARIWTTHYAEKLRRMGLLVRAAELDNVAAASSSFSPADNSTQTQRNKHTGITPKTTTAKATCSICYCKIQGVQQLCSICLHTTHLSCLKGFVDGWSGSGNGGEEEMECPSGCGCACAMVAFEDTVWDVSEERASTPKPAPPLTVRRKWSFTDPRRWREQVQGDSW